MNFLLYRIYVFIEKIAQNGLQAVLGVVMTGISVLIFKND